MFYEKGLATLIVTLILTFMCLIMFTSSQQIKNIKLTYKPFSENEQYLLSLTNNKILMYDLKNLPTNKNYTITLIYEVYKNSEKIKDNIITQSLSDGSNEEIKSQTIGLNITSDQIRFLMATNSAYYNSKLDIDENLSECSQIFLSKNVDVQPGTDIYLYYATTSQTISDNLIGNPIKEDTLTELIKDKKLHAFIKLRFEEN